MHKHCQKLFLVSFGGCGNAETTLKLVAKILHVALNEQVSEPVRHRAIALALFGNHGERWNQLAGGNSSKQ